MRAGIFQCAGGGLDPDQRLLLLNEALSRHSLDLLVCPELFLSGYNAGSSITERAEPVDGPFCKKISTLARNNSVAIVFGYPEKEGNILYNAAACIDARGQLLANHRKLLLPPGFELDYFTAGETLTLFDLHGMRCAILICYDAEFPEAVRACTEAGAEVVIVPTALADNWGSVANKLMPTRAFENGVWLLYANHAGEENGLCYLGGSCIVAPDGSDSARAGIDQMLIHCEIDTDAVAQARARLPYLHDVNRLRKTLSRP